MSTCGVRAAEVALKARVAWASGDSVQLRNATLLA